jgi:prolyl-tRNA synthetase
VGRLLACLAEEYHDEQGLKLPISTAPYQVHMVSLVKDAQVGEDIYNQLKSAGVEVLYDDRKESAGVKFADADLIGAPIRITVGNRSLKEGKVEIKLRANLDETLSFELDGLATKVKSLVMELTDGIEKAVVPRSLD